MVFDFQGNRNELSDPKVYINIICTIMKLRVDNLCLHMALDISCSELKKRSKRLPFEKEHQENATTTESPEPPEEAEIRVKGMPHMKPQTQTKKNCNRSRKTTGWGVGRGAGWGRGRGGAGRGLN